jgi:hypothetical protein
MRKSGSQPVEYTQKVVQKLRTKIMQILGNSRLSTLCRSYAQICAQLIPRIVHTLRTYFTEVSESLSPLSTALIIENDMEIKN